MKRLMKTKIRNDFQIDETGVGLMNRGVLLTPVKTVPEEYKREKQTDADKETGGYLAVVDTIRYSISFVPLHKPTSKTRSLLVFARKFYKYYLPFS
jgi:hypothetical protein